MRFLAVTLLLLAGAARAGTLQQDFDAAQALLDAGKVAEARDAFTALLTRFPANASGRSSNLVRLRLGSALASLDDPEAAEPYLRAAVAALTRPEDRDEKAYALLRLAGLAEAGGRIDTAARRYRELLASGAMAPDSYEQITLRAALARTLIWSAPDEARRLVDDLLALPPERLARGDTRALVEALRARVDLNNGQPELARRRLQAAADLAGGATTMRINVSDIRVRGDLLIASHLAGKPADTAKYVAWSGAGYLLKAGLAAPGDRNLPGCAPQTSLAPDAVAVIEFAVETSGKVRSVSPIYASVGSGRRDGDDTGPESLFVQAVRSWSWRPDEVAKAEPIWRQAIRMEIRCQTGRGGSDPVDAGLRRREIDWFAREKLTPPMAQPGSDAVALVSLRRELAAREAAQGAMSAALIPILLAIGDNGAATLAEQRAARRRRLHLLQLAGAPSAVTGLLELDLALDGYNRVARPPGSVVEAVAALVPRFDAAGDAHLALLARLRLAELHQASARPGVAATLLAEIVAAPETILPAGDPIRTAALLRRADVAAQQRDLATATAAIAATGLTAEQCALVDVRPSPLNNRIAMRDFSALATRYASSGYIAVGHDIDVSGQPVNVRTLWAIPPFLFDADTEAAVAKFRFQPVFRPGSTSGCTGSIQPVRIIGGP